MDEELKAQDADVMENDMPEAAAEDATSIDAPDVEIPTDIVPMDAVVAADTAMQGKMQGFEMLQGLGQDVIYLMGLSFILGSLFTVFVLLVLDFMRRNNADAK